MLRLCSGMWRSCNLLLYQACVSTLLLFFAVLEIKCQLQFRKKVCLNSGLFVGRRLIQACFSSHNQCDDSSSTFSKMNPYYSLNNTSTHNRPCCVLYLASTESKVIFSGTTLCLGRVSFSQKSGLYKRMKFPNACVSCFFVLPTHHHHHDLLLHDVKCCMMPRTMSALRVIRSVFRSHVRFFEALFARFFR